MELKKELIALMKGHNTLYGVDAGYHDSVIHPANGEGRVGKRGIDRKFDCNKVVDLASRMNPRPNIIVRNGNGKWYFKRLPLENLATEIKKQSWRDTSRTVMHVIDWK
jgi:hypothetical protein